MDDDERQAVIAEARRNCERLADFKAAPRDPLREDALEKWSRGMPRPEPPPRQRGPSAAEQTANWVKFTDDRIARAIAANHRLWQEIIGAVIAQERKRARAEAKAMIDQLRAEVTLQRSHDGYGGSGEVIDLAALPLRRSNAA